MFPIKIPACNLLLPIGLASGLALSACVPHQPLPYSPHYSRIALVDESTVEGAAGPVHKGYDAPPGRAARKGRQARTMVVPQACLTPDVAEQPLYLPPGCANSLNLQMMVEREKDLFRGREPGPAAAVPAVRAAERYLYGGTEAERRAGRNEAQKEQPSPSAPQGSERAGQPSQRR